MRGVYSGKTLTEILEKIDQATLEPKIKQAFKNEVNKFKRGIRTPHTSIDDLKIIGNDKIAKIRKLIELKYFFDQYKKYLNTQNQNKKQDEEFLKIEQELSTSFQHISNCDYNKAINITNIDPLCCRAYSWISQIPKTNIPLACNSTYKKSAEIAESAQQRMNSYRELSNALDIKDNPAKQKEAIKSVFLTEYSSSSVVAKEVLDKTQSKSALADIDAMAEEYVDFSVPTERGKSSITEDQNATYLSALKQISETIKDRNLSNTQYQFKLSHKIPVGQETRVDIKDTAGNILLQVLVTINSKLPYSLSKSPNSNHLVLSYIYYV
jgi:hypothetical protein